MLRKIILGLALAAGASLPIVGAAEAAVGDGVVASHIATQLMPVEKAQFFWGGRQYCWYDDGWYGPGWYWCGYAWYSGYGWGGGYGWHGWRGGGWLRGRRLHGAVEAGTAHGRRRYGTCTAAAEAWQRGSGGGGLHGGGGGLHGGGGGMARRRRRLARRRRHGRRRHAHGRRRHAHGRRRHAHGRRRHAHGRRRHAHGRRRHAQGRRRHAHGRRGMQGRRRHAHGRRHEAAAACTWAAAACKGAAAACTWAAAACKGAAAAVPKCTEPHSLGWVATMARSTAAGSPGDRFVQPSRKSDLARNDPLPPVQPATPSVSRQTSARQRKTTVLCVEPWFPLGRNLARTESVDLPSHSVPP